LFTVTLGWVFFDAASAGEALGTLGALFGATGRGVDPGALYYLRSYAIPLLLAFVGSTPLIAQTARRLAERFRWLALVGEPVVIVGSLVVCTAFLVDGTFNPFIYFRF
jgi:alginate O-acetyltransferase complex protein AlgI